MCVTPSWQLSNLLAEPMFFPLLPYLQQLNARSFPCLEDYNGLLQQSLQPVVVASGQALRFVPQRYGDLPFEMQYEPRCYLTGEVATRENNWHDFFNALVWLAFPQSKAALNARHYQALVNTEATAGASQRGVSRDVSTLFDESGVVVVSHRPELLQLVRDFKWRELFVAHRQSWHREITAYVFGHGLYEKALSPYIGMTGQAILLQVSEDFWPLAAWAQQQKLDALLAQYLAPLTVCQPQQVLSPLPILGVPGWWPDNQQPVFYENTGYFRPGRRR